MRNYRNTLVIVIALFTACKEAPNHDNVLKKTSNYPLIVDSLGLNKIYDETKWRMYCYQCDDSIIFQEKLRNKNKVFFGFLDLKFDTVTVTKDQTEINFVFTYDGKDCDSKFVRNVPIRGVVYKTNTESILYYSMTADANPYLRDSCPDPRICSSRFVNPLQPQVVKFINDHKKELNPWFYKMAIQKGVVK